MFEHIKIDWIANVDPSRSKLDDYIEAMQLHRHDLSDWITRTDNRDDNLASFIKKWKERAPDSNVVVFLSSYSKEDFPNLENLSSKLPKGMYVIILARYHILSKYENIFVASLPVDNESEFRFRTGAVLARLIHLQPQGNPLKPITKSYTERNIDFKCFRDFSCDGLLDQEVQVRIEEDGIKYDFLSMLNSNSRGLLVIGQSAINQKVVKLPHFQRWTWANDFVGNSCIILNDPMHYIGECLEAGWWFGTKDIDIVEKFCEIVLYIANYLDLSSKDIYFYGGSAGGFSSLHMSSVIKGSKAIIDIPQIDMSKYHVKGAANLASQAAFGVNIQEVPMEYRYRIDVIERFKKYQNIPDFYYLQNSKDSSHIYSQFKYFIDSVLELQRNYEWADSNFQIEFYKSWHFQRGGHIPLNRQDTMERINTYFEKTQMIEP